MKLTISIFLFFSILSAAFCYDGYPRYRNIDILHYDFVIKLNDSTDIIEGKAVISLRILEHTDTIKLDLVGPDGFGKGMTVTSVAIAGKFTGWQQGKTRVIIAAGSSAGINDTITLTLLYHGVPKDGLIISKSKFGERTFFADHWPDRAHNYLPCIDHPYDKATVDFVITAPEQYNVVANGRLVEQSSLTSGLKLTHWSEKIPLPVKVMAFGVARFAAGYVGNPENVPVWTWVYARNRNEGFSDYSIAVKPLKYYNQLLGKYPFEKLANVQSRTIYGGLENAGAIFYAENSVNGLDNDEGLMAHEIAHQWFGDCVTEADWHHIWLSEGFATYLTSMYMESVYGRDKLAADMAHTRDMVLDYYQRNPAPVIDTTITDLMQLLSINSYQKGGWILHMLRQEIGDENFKNGLRLFYTRFKNSNVVTSDFLTVMEEVSGKDLSWFFEQWLWKAGQPELKITVHQGIKSGTKILVIEQMQKDLFNFPLELLVVTSQGNHSEKIRISCRITDLDLAYSDIKEVKADPEVKLLFRRIE